MEGASCSVGGLALSGASSYITTYNGVAIVQDLM